MPFDVRAGTAPIASLSKNSPHPVEPFKQRVEFIDVARGITILLVVFGHNWISNHEDTFVSRLFSSFRMPLFFFLSGVFLPHRRSWKELLAGKTDALLKPYFVTAIVVGMGLLVTGEFHARGHILGVLYGSWNTLFWGSLWFLPHLWLVVIACWALSNVLDLGGRREAVKVWVMMGSLLIAGYSLLIFCEEFTIPFSYRGKDLVMFGLPWGLDLVCLSSFYCLLGFLLREKVRSFRPTGSMVVLHALMFMGLFITFNCTLNFAMRRYDHIVISTVQALLGISLVLSIAKWISRFRISRTVLAYIGSGSLFIVILHGPIQENLFRIYNEMVPGHPYAIGVMAFLPACLMPLVFWELVKRNRFLSTMFLPVKSIVPQPRKVSIPETTPLMSEP